MTEADNVAKAKASGVLQRPVVQLDDSLQGFEGERRACRELVDYLRNETDIAERSPDLIPLLEGTLVSGLHAKVLELRINDKLVGWLFDVKDIWVLQYHADWVLDKHSYALSPGLALRGSAYVDGSSNRPVQWYFDNLLPEEDLRKSLAKDAKLVHEDIFGLLRHYGAESAGSLVLSPLGQGPAPEGVRELTAEALNARIRNLPNAPLTRDAPKRMSLAGAQHKMVVVAATDKKGALVGPLYEPLPGTASTHILKPNSASASYPHSVVNEYFVMRLAQRMKLDVPSVFRRYMPESAYLITRFDRIKATGVTRARDGLVEEDGAVPRVDRVHVIDTCQLLNQPRTLKYEQARLDTLTSALEKTRSKARARSSLYQWLVFNVLVGNGDNHLKNVSFVVGTGGIELAPGYDMLCTAVYDTRLYADQNAVWPMTHLGTVLGDINKFSDVTYQSLIDAGVALGLGADTARRLLGDMLRNILKAADDLVREIEGEYGVLKRGEDSHIGAPPPAVQGGEMQLLRAIIGVVMADMVRQVRQSAPGLDGATRVE
ncbi:HipA domain-containing protein [Hydrogenophaga sp.]|uniref:HipA domain-containing protein n=1 Tax=Hydrogenophaga sp. TaxID=1904254 RepID=UPI002716A063|nr:HipA domain-containing protein [Hydrogenophaga sp.]MDO9435081.1 HipA domain-containing protein [Hydrogenophaga sp.]